jgi:hypothetical protein
MAPFGVSLTPGATMLFGLLGFVYTDPVESVIGDVFTRPAHPTASPMAARTTVFIHGLTSDYVMAVLGSNPMQEHLHLAVYSSTVLAFKASREELLT